MEIMIITFNLFMVYTCFCSETDAYRTVITKRGTAIHYKTGLLKIYEPEITFFHILGIINFLLHVCTFHVLDFVICVFYKHIYCSVLTAYKD